VYIIMNFRNVEAVPYAQVTKDRLVLMEYLEGIGPKLQWFGRSHQILRQVKEVRYAAGSSD
jgi:hypothetical protein